MSTYLGAYERADGYNGSTIVIHTVYHTGKVFCVTPAGWHREPSYDAKLTLTEAADHIQREVTRGAWIAV